MADFPRTIEPSQVTMPIMPGSLRSVSQTGVVQQRTHGQNGRIWQETFEMLRASDADVQALLTFIEKVWNRGESFTIEHLLLPGSGLAPNGLGTAGVTVSGADQTGTSLVTTGWPLSTSDVVRAGDVIKIGGFNTAHLITADASSDGSGNATLEIAPAIVSGSSPANGASITTTDVKVKAVIWDRGSFPKSRQPDFYGSLTLTFRETP